MSLRQVLLYYNICLNSVAGLMMYIEENVNFLTQGLGSH